MKEGGYSEQNGDDQRETYLAKEIRAYILLSHATDGETWLHDLGGLMSPIIQTHPLNNLMMDTQLSVDLG